MKKIFALLMASVMVLGIAGCGSKEAETTAAPAQTTAAAAEQTTAAPKETAAPAETYVWKFSSVATMEEAQGLAQAAFEEKMEELSGGAVDVQNYYSGTLYSQDACTEAIAIGDLEINSSSPAYVSEYYPAAGMFTAAYMFKNYDHLQAFIASDAYEDYRKAIEDNTNFVLLAILYQGARGLDLNTDAEVMKPEDLASLTIRMPNTEAWLHLGSSLGFNPTGLAFTEVYTAQQTGVIDGNDNPIGIATANGFNEVSKQYVRTNHLVDNVYFIMNKDLFYSLSEEMQAQVLEAAAYAKDVMDTKILADEASLYADWESQGIKVVDPDLDAFVEYSFNYYQENGLTETWDMDLYNKIQALEY